MSIKIGGDDICQILGSTIENSLHMVQIVRGKWWEGGWREGGEKKKVLKADKYTSPKESWKKVETVQMLSVNGPSLENRNRALPIFTIFSVICCIILLSWLVLSCLAWPCLILCYLVFSCRVIVLWLWLSRDCLVLSLFHLLILPCLSLITTGMPTGFLLWLD